MPLEHWKVFLGATKLKQNKSFAGLEQPGIVAMSLPVAGGGTGWGLTPLPTQTIPLFHKKTSGNLAKITVCCSLPPRRESLHLHPLSCVFGMGVWAATGFRYPNSLSISFPHSWLNPLALPEQGAAGTGECLACAQLGWFSLSPQLNSAAGTRQTRCILFRRSFLTWIS